MKLLFDQNLSFKLCRQFNNIFPGSSQVRLVGLEKADDRTLWDFAKDNGFALVTQDSDFADLAGLLGPPPKIIWLRTGNQPTRVIEQALLRHREAIAEFEADGEAACLEIY